MKKKINIAVVGCGGFGNFHIDNLLKYDEVSIVSIASTDVKKLKTTALKVPEARIYTNSEDMLEKEKKIDCLFVCATPNKHFSIEQKAALKGIALYIEKPLELNYQKALINAEIIKRSGVICSVGYQERYNPILQTIKQHIKQNPCLAITGRWIDSLPTSLWWRDKAKSGGQIVEQTTHIIDAMRFIFGEGTVISAISSKGINKQPFYSTDDASQILIQFENGVIANVISGCYLESTAKPDIGMEFFGSKVSVKYTWGKCVEYISADGTQKVDFSDEFHHVAVDIFLKAVMTGDVRHIKSTYEDALKTLKLTLDAEEKINNAY